MNECNGYLLFYEVLLFGWIIWISDECNGVACLLFGYLLGGSVCLMSVGW